MSNYPRELLWYPSNHIGVTVGLLESERYHGDSVTAVMMRSPSDIYFSWKQATCLRGDID
jgi:hypothetical protein